MKPVVCFLLLISFFLMPCYAEREKEVHVNKIRGEYTITTDMDISPKVAAERAELDAKQKALKKVCGEQLKSWDMLASGAEGESFNSVNMIQVDGEIVGCKVIDYGQNINPAREKEITFWCVIDAIVKKGIEPDPDFEVAVKGIRASYQAEEELTFSILSSRDAYLKVFIFENEELGYKLYPNDNEENVKIVANEECKFPTNRRSVYELYTDKDIETDILVFVLTKTEKPFLEETTSRKEIEYWMAKISNDQKFVSYKSINILKK